MNKEEFLQTLRRDLSGDVPQSVLEENVQYYREYIDGEIKKGRTEEEVIEELGTPRLIAKNIEDTTEMDEGIEPDPKYSGSSDTYTGGGSSAPDYGRDAGSQFHLFDLSKWYGRLLVLLIVIAVVYMVFVIIGGIFRLLAPLLWPILIIWLIVSIIRGGRRQ